MTFLELLRSHGVRTVESGHHHCRPGWVQMDCPWCGRNSGKYHLGYSVKGNFCACWKCNGHSLVAVLHELTGLSYEECRRLLDGTEKPRWQQEEKPRGHLVVPEGLGPLLGCHRTYLLSRGFDPEVIEPLWRVRGLGLVPRLSWRIWIPIFYQGQVVSWTTRAIGDRVTLRYLSASAEEEVLNHKDLLYGEDLVRSAVCVVEGPLDAWAIGPGAVATCGTGFSRAQVLKLSKYPVRGVCFDKEPAAQARARDLVTLLADFPGTTINIGLDAKDAAEASKSEIAALRKELAL